MLLTGLQAQTTALFALFPVGLFELGYFGTERLWYLRLWRGQNLTGPEIWSRSWGYLRRYFGLGLIVLVPFVPLYFLLSATVDPNGALILAVSGLSYIVMDFFVTFATPALAYSTDDPVKAIRITSR